MPSHEPRKVYSIEKTQLRQKTEGAGPATPESPGPAPVPTGSFGLAEAIMDIRQDIAELKEMAQGGVTSAPAPEAEDSDATMDRDLRIELAQMVRTIARAKTELAQIRHPQADDDRLGEASGELDAIVKATEGATNNILESTESIEKELTNIAALAQDDEDIMTITDKIANNVTAIMEACNFQDITGQRINKVVQTMFFVEERIRAMIDIWGMEAFADLPVPDSVAGEEEDQDAGLLAGPQMEGQGISQSEIDALFD